jgi:hypothetical protein
MLTPVSPSAWSTTPLATGTHNTSRPVRSDAELGVIHHLGHLESQIDQVLSWAEVLGHIGTCPNTIQPGAIQVIANALDDLAGTLRDRYQAAWDNATGQGHLRDSDA